VSTQSGDSEIIPTLIWYYYACRRETWIMSHQVNPDQDDKTIAIGRILHENSHMRDKKEISLPGMKLDIVTREDGKIIIDEIKKSSKSLKAAEMQLLYYLYRLRNKGIDAKGRLYLSTERKTIDINLDSASVIEIESAVKDITGIIGMTEPPKLERIKFCGNCAYRELCVQGALRTGSSAGLDRSIVWY
jgi:CRISPR-associated exonuclease Cas4